MILITGASGQLGTELQHLLAELQLPYLAKNSKELDITDRKLTLATVKETQADVIFHCAAYTAVDQAEENQALNEKINVEGTRNIALAAKAVGAKLVYISTDYVFDGNLKEGQYSVGASTNPLNEYGRTKLLGEQIVAEELTEYYIIRTSWLFGRYGHNFVFTMERLARDHQLITVVNDQWGRPTWTRTLAEFMLYLIKRKAPFGIYHLANKDSCSWYEFAKAILKDTPNVTVKPITSAQYPQKARRPQYSILDLSKTENLGFEILSWKKALKMMRSK